MVLSNRTIDRQRVDDGRVQPMAVAAALIDMKLSDRDKIGFEFEVEIEFSRWWPQELAPVHIARRYRQPAPAKIAALPDFNSAK